jgi:hypothetical protein
VLKTQRSKKSKGGTLIKKIKIFFFLFLNPFNQILKKFLIKFFFFFLKFDKNFVRVPPFDLTTTKKNVFSPQTHLDKILS